MTASWCVQLTFEWEAAEGCGFIGIPTQGCGKACSSNWANSQNEHDHEKTKVKLHEVWNQTRSSATFLQSTYCKELTKVDSTVQTIQSTLICDCASRIKLSTVTSFQKDKLAGDECRISAWSSYGPLWYERQEKSKPISDYIHCWCSDVGFIKVRGKKGWILES